MACQPKSDNYKWLVLVAACFSQMLRAGFIAGTLSLFSIYYQQRFNDRTLSSSIGSIQLSVANMAGFPAVLLNKKIGERWTQIIGGLLTAAGMTATAFTETAWQGILANGVTTGLGAAFIAAATYSTLSKYFPGNQLAPYAAITVCQNIGVMATPQVIGFAMRTLGFTQTFLICASLMSLNIITGLTFLPKPKDESVSQKRRANSVVSRFVLKVPGQKQGIYTLPKLSVDLTAMEQGSFHKTDSSGNLKELAANDSPKMKKVQSLGLISLSRLMERVSDKDYDTSSESSIETASDKSSQVSDKEAKEPTLYDKVNESHGSSIADLMDDSGMTKQTVKQVFKTPSAINFLVTSFISTGGYIAYNSIIGDYCLVQLKYTNEQYILGLTILGISQLITGIIYLAVTRFISFSSSFMYVTSTVASAGVTFLFMTCPNINMFYVLMAVGGLFKSLYIASTFGAGMEVTSPAQAVVMFMVVSLVEGIGGIAFPYISSYLQVQVNVRAGLYTAGGVQLLGGLSLLPLSLRYLIAPKTYSPDKGRKEEVEQTGYTPNRPF